MDVNSGRVTTIDGVSCSYTVQGEGPDVVFLHGLSGSGLSWGPISWAVAASGHRCWTLDFRGHGESDKPAGEANYVVENYAKDASALLDEIDGSAVLVGHSLGGLVSAFLAVAGDARVRGAYLEDPPYFLNDRAEWDKTAFALAFPFAKGLIAHFQSEARPVGHYEALMAHAPSPAGGTGRDHSTAHGQLSGALAWSQMNPECWEAAIDGTLFDGFDPTKPLQCPTRVVRADPALGPAFAPEHEAWLAAASPDATVVVADGCGHSIHSSREREQWFLDDLQAFLGQHA